MKVEQLHELTPKQFFDTTPTTKNSPLMPQKVKNDAKIKSKSNLGIEGNIEKESCSTTPVDPKTVVQPYTDLQTRPLGPQKDRIDHKIESNSNLRIQGIIENKSCSTT